MVTRPENLCSPTCREVAVQIEARWIAWHRNGEPVEILDRSLIEQAISSDTWFDAEWTNGNHHSWFARMFDPCAVRIGNAHRANRPIAVYVSDVEAWPLEAVSPRPRTHARAVELRRISESVFDAVGVDARCDVERPRMECFANVSISFEVFEEVLNDVEGRHTTGDFGCMDVGVDPVGRLRVVSPSRRIRDGGKHEVPTKV